MTTTVKRGAGRPAAAARTAKHAQKNVQTGPRPAVAVAQAIADEAKPEAGTNAYGRMSVDELKARAKDLQIKPLPRTKGGLLNAILEAERLDAFADEVTTGIIANAEDEREQADEAPSSNAPETDADPKGAAKALKVSEALAPHGWIYGALTGQGPRVTATFTRGIEALTVVWDGGVFNYEGTSHAIGDRITRVRNVSAALKLGARKPEEAEADLERVVKNRTFNKARVRAEGDEAPPRPKLKFDPETVTEPDLFKALAGKVVVWVNRISRDTEDATVTTNPRNFTVLPPRPDGSRILQFTSPNGFRALRIADITRVLPAGSNPRKQRGVVEDTEA